MPTFFTLAYLTDACWETGLDTGNAVIPHSRHATLKQTPPDWKLQIGSISSRPKRYFIQQTCFIIIPPSDMTPVYMTPRSKCPRNPEGGPGGGGWPVCRVCCLFCSEFGNWLFGLFFEAKWIVIGRSNIILLTLSFCSHFLPLHSGPVTP